MKAPTAAGAATRLFALFGTSGGALRVSGCKLLQLANCISKHGAEVRAERTRKLFIKFVLGDFAALYSLGTLENWLVLDIVASCKQTNNRYQNKNFKHLSIFRFLQRPV